MDVKIVEFPPTRVAMLTHLGHPDKVNASAAKFIAWRRETGQSPIASSQTFGIARHDPQTTPPAQFRFDICGSVRQPIAENDVGVVNSEIPRRALRGGAPSGIARQPPGERVVFIPRMATRQR